MRNAIECSSIRVMNATDKLSMYKLSENNIVVFEIGIDDANVNQDEVKPKIKNCVEKKLTNLGMTSFCVHCLLEGLCSVQVSMGEAEDENALKRKSLELGEIIRDAVYDELKLTASVGISHGIDNIGLIGFAAFEANNALKDRVFRNKGSVIHASDMCGIEVASTSDKLEALIQVGDKEEAVTHIDAFFRYMERNVRDELEIKKRLVMNLVLSLESYFDRTVGESEQRTGIVKKTIYDMERSGSELELRNIIVNFVNEVVLHFRNIHYNKHGLLMDKAKKYISMNYSSNISIEDVAHHIGISVSHFSKIFREYTGKTFVRYLNETRIEKAKELLRNPRYRLVEISEKVGFNGVRYFIKVFKDITGYTPIYYKNILLKNINDDKSKSIREQ